jgi:hypothetical protein
MRYTYLDLDARNDPEHSEKYTQLDLLNILLDYGHDEDAHYYGWCNYLNEDENNIDLCQKLINNLENPSEEFLTLLLPMLKYHAEECLKDFKNDLVKDIIK